MKRNDGIDTVHVMFKTHLDVGFTDYAKVVRQQYFKSHLPRAMQLAEQFRERNGSERFVWTTGSWLIYEYLEQASAGDRRAMERAIDAGDIAWHGLPFSTHSELMDASLYRFGLSLSQKLDARFGKNTIAAKMTDVPGHTRAIVPILAEAGIRFLIIGVNPSSTAPDVPDVFVWRHIDGSDVIVVYHKTNYGRTTVVPGMSAALVFDHTGDNLGPPDKETILQTFDRLRKDFPNANVVASRLDDYAAKLLAVKDSLPIVTGEIGDTWIHGAGTDPKKVAWFRRLCALRNEWQETGRANTTDTWFERYSRFLLLVPEHTWGMDEKSHLDDYAVYDANGLHILRQTDKCKRFEASWAEQREYISEAIRSVDNGSLAGEAMDALAKTEPVRPDSTGFCKVNDLNTRFDTQQFEIQFDPETGAICHLCQNSNGRNWATEKKHLGLYRYELFSADDYDRFGKQYFRLWPHPEDSTIKDFMKPGMEAVAKVSRVWFPRLMDLYRREAANEVRFLLELCMPDEAVDMFGAPAELTIEVILPAEAPTVEMSLQWFSKQACRLPEASWFSFCPSITNANGWTMDKLGWDFSPLEVVRNGNRRLHAVGKGVKYRDERGSCEIQSVDVPLVAPGEPSLLDFNNRQPSLRRGMHFNLHNNVWGTNFPMWYEEDALFRFILRFQ